jgi:hypothetical protein
MNPATGLPEFQEDYGDDYSGVDLGVYSQPVGQTSIQSSDIMPTLETGGEPVTPTYGTVAQRFEAPVEVPSYAQDLFPPVPSRSFIPQLPQMPNEFVGPQQVRDFKQEAIDQGAAPGRSFEDMLKTGAKQVLGTREGLAGLGTVASLLQARQAGKQAQQMQRELSAVGAPQRALGKQMIAQGQRGEVTPVQRQQMAALDARQKQQLAQRGLTSSTAQQQQQLRMQEMQQRGAQDLIDQGIKIAGIGDQYQAAAIRAGYAADEATRNMLNTTLTNLYRTIYGNVATPEK